jgi:hypothetical protein
LSPAISPLGGYCERPVDQLSVFLRNVAALGSVAMNDDDPAMTLEALKAEHRDLDERIQVLSSEPTGDQLELARLKRRKLMIKDQIQMIVDSNIPDIIA